MGNKIHATIDSRNFTWEMTNRYDLQKTAFIWVEDEPPIFDLTAELPQDRPYGWSFPRGMPERPDKLFLMKPLKMRLLPDWCDVERVYEIEEGDTHEWMLVKRRGASKGKLVEKRKPLALISNQSGWLLQYEDDYPRYRDILQWESNLCVYGLNRAASILEDVSPPR